VQQVAAAVGRWDRTVLGQPADELTPLLSDLEARTAAVAALVAALSSQGAPWTGPAAVVRVEVDLPDGGRDSRSQVQTCTTERMMMAY